MVTTTELARLAGVSQSTVSRVLTGNPHVSPGTRERVLRALETHFPEADPKVLAVNRTGNVGVATSDITNPYFPELLESLEENARARGLNLVLWNERDPSLPATTAGVRSGIVDGVLFTNATGASSAAIQRIVDRGTPCVLVNRGLHHLGVDQVTSDNAQIGRLAADYLLDHGRHSIGMVVGPEDTEAVVERRESFLQQLWDRAGVDVRRGAIHRGPPTFETGFAAAGELLEQGVDSIFCINDLLALGALAGLNRLGVRVPEDVWLVGVDGLPMAAWAGFDLTTIRQPLEEITRRAFELLRERIDESGERPRVETFPGELIVRGSTASAPLRDPGEGPDQG